VESGRGKHPRVGLVLAGGGARGAYEIGALSALLPHLERRGERPRILVGTSIGALNTAYLAATAERPAAESSTEGEGIWRETGYADVLKPLVSLRSLDQAIRYVGQLAGLVRTPPPALADPSPLEPTLRRMIPFAQLHSNVEQEILDAAAVVATSALTSRSVVFHHGGVSPERDDKRGIDYVAAQLDTEHVRASAAIPGVFPAVHVSSPEPARGWYWDGSTRLNTPIKPALALGAERVVVIALNSMATEPGQLAGESRPDLFQGMAEFFQPTLVDSLVQDVQTLAGINEGLIEEGDGESHGQDAIPYIFIAPRERESVGAIASRVFEDSYRGFAKALRRRDLAFLGRMVAGDADPVHGELLSYLFFAPEFAAPLIELGRNDAGRWLSSTHDDGPWELGSMAAKEMIGND
jgi:NTE family protein